jgi:hypothetical protein
MQETANKQKRITLKTLHEMLNGMSVELAEKVHLLFMANYLRNVLTDQYGWNIRNQASHGLLGADNFNLGMADRVVHAFLMLCTFKKKE